MVITLVHLDCCHPFVTNSQGLHLWLVLALFLSTSYVERAQAVVSWAIQATLAEFYGSWYSFVVSNNLAMCSIIDAVYHAVYWSEKHKSWQNSLLPLLTMARVFGFDKLYNSSIIYSVKWIMALVQRLTLLKCHHIQLKWLLWCWLTSGLSLIALTQQSIKRYLWLCIFTTWVPWCISLPDIGLPTAASQSSLNACMLATSAGSLNSLLPDPMMLSAKSF